MRFVADDVATTISRSSVWCHPLSFEASRGLRASHSWRSSVKLCVRSCSGRLIQTSVGGDGARGRRWKRSGWAASATSVLAHWRPTRRRLLLGGRALRDLLQERVHFSLDLDDRLGLGQLGP